MDPTTVHASEVVGQLVLIVADPIHERVRHAIAGFLAGYSGTTLEAYRLARYPSALNAGGEGCVRTSVLVCLAGQELLSESRCQVDGSKS